MKKLNLEKNTIGGTLPTSLANLKGLEGLNLSNNLLSGPLLHIQWGNLNNLEHLHLSNNKVCFSSFVRTLLLVLIFLVRSTLSVLIALAVDIAVDIAVIPSNPLLILVALLVLIAMPT